MGASAIKTALYEAIAGLGFTTYTVTPQASDGGDASQFPHIQIGTVVASEWDTNTENGFDFTARIHTRWRGRDEEPGLLMQDEIYTRLHHGALDIQGYQLILLERQVTSVDPMQGSFDGVCEYHGIIQEE
jgi:hypothetical protein